MHTQEQLADDWALGEECVAVNDRVWFEDHDGVRVVCVGNTPFYTYDRTDRVQHLFCACQFIEAKLAKQCEVVRAFGIWPRISHGTSWLRKKLYLPAMDHHYVSLFMRGHISVSEHFSGGRRKVGEHGIAGLVPQKKGPKRRHKGGGAVGRRVVKLWNKGMGRLEIAARVGVSEGTVRNVLREKGLYRMFARWKQENWFKYMDEQFALDVPVDYATQPDDPDRLVVNPAWRTLYRETKTARATLRKAEAAYGRVSLSKKSSPARSCLAAEGEEAQETYERLCKQRSDTPREIRLGDVTDGDPVKLTYERKLLTDTIEMCVYDVETQLTEMLDRVFCRNDFEGRAVVREIFQTPADLTLFPGQLHIHLDQLNRKRRDPPGPQTIWIGMQRMHDFGLSWQLFGPDARAGP